MRREHYNRQYNHFEECATYAVHGNLQDLYDICLAVNGHPCTISRNTLDYVVESIIAKDMEYIDYTLAAKQGSGIDAFMGKEYLMKWLQYKQSKKLFKNTRV